MKSTLITATVFVTSLLAACSNSHVNGDRSSTAARQMIEGVYVLKEAHVGGEVVLPPRVSGRFILRNGVVVTILHYRLTDEDQTSTASFGRYVLDAEHFSYRYDEPMVLRQTKSGNTVSRVPPWDGMRKFKLTVENQAVRLQTENAKQELLFSPDGLIYSENGQIQRVWQRVAEPQM